MNTRHVVTGKAWFGGGADLTPIYPDPAAAEQFHAALAGACDGYEPECYAQYKKWCDEYFFLPHRGEARGAGGIFFDYLDAGDREREFAFVQAVGEAFLAVYPPIVRARMNRPWTGEQRQHQLVRRGRYVEFNLLYDRGTRFGLRTGGNVEAILMSCRPRWRGRRTTTTIQSGLSGYRSIQAIRRTLVEPGVPNGHAGGDHDALAGAGDLLAMGGAHRLLHHVVEAGDVGEVDAMRAPEQRQAARGREVRGEGQDRRRGPLARGAQRGRAGTGEGHDRGGADGLGDLTGGGADRVGIGVLGRHAAGVERR